MLIYVKRQAELMRGYGTLMHGSRNSRRDCTSAWL